MRKSRYDFEQYDMRTTLPEDSCTTAKVKKKNGGSEIVELSIWAKQVLDKWGMVDNRGELDESKNE